MFSTNISDIPTDDAWTELQKGGPNGFFLILLSYCWWGAYAIDASYHEIQPAYSTWMDMLPDIEWVLVKMVDGLESSLKRLRDDEDEQMDDSNPRKRFVSYIFLFFSPLKTIHFAAQKPNK